MAGVTATAANVGTVCAMTVPTTLPGDAGAARYDLRTFFHAVGNPLFGSALNGEPPDRRDTQIDVEVLETEPQIKLSSAPLDVAAFVDGVQSSLIVTHREHRPVYMTFQAAGAVGQAARLLGLKERLTLVCSTADRDWVDSVNLTGDPIPVTEVPEVAPPDVERAAYAQLGDWRERLERSLVEELMDEGVGPLVVDGSLLGRPHNTQLHGVVKTTKARYLPDESILYGLPAGWRSSIFQIPAGADGCQFDRYSCYLRLHDARHHAWAHGLIRLEAFDRNHLDPLGARAMAERQSQRSGDGRWDRHLASVAITEKVLRSRRPNVFDF